MRTKSLCLQVFLTDVCNLDCKYCFQAKGNEFIQFDQFKQTFENIIQMLKPIKLELFFCGGEPFLAFKVIRQIVHYIENYKDVNSIDYSITTNGTLLSHQIVSFIKDHKISVTVSLDGNEMINEFNRPAKSGESSFNAVLKSIKLLEQEHVGYFLNATLLNYKKVLDVYRYLSKEFPNSIYTITEMVGKQVFINNTVQRKEYINLWHRILDEEFEYFLSKKKWRLKNFVIYLGRLISGKQTLHYCNAGNGTYCISTNGKLYPCYRLAKFEEYELELIDIIKNEVEKGYNFEKCSTCNIRYFCGGGCLANAKYVSGNIFVPCETDCFTMQIHLELSIYLYNKLFGYSNNVIVDFFK